MRCPRCGAEWPDEMSFCPACSAPLVREPDVSAGPAPAPEPAPAPAPVSTRGMSKKALVFCGAAAIAVVLCLVMVLGNGMGLLTVDPSKEITESAALEGCEKGSTTTKVLTTSTWGANDGYVVTSSTLEKVTSGEINSSSGTRKVYNASITVVYENDSFKVTEKHTRVFDAKTKEMIDETGSAATEPKGLADKKILENLSEILQKVSTSSSHNTSLQSIYSDPTGIKVANNETDASGGTVQISLSRTAGLKSYSGIVTAKFSWDSDKGDWKLASSTASDDAWTARYDLLKGTWTGVLTGTKVSFAAHNCYGAKVQPLKIVITDVAGTGQVKLSVTTIYHNHASSDMADEDSDPADMVATISDASSTVSSDGKFSLQSAEGAGKMLVTVQAAESDGNEQKLTAVVKSQTGLGGFSDDAFYDTYALTKEK